MKLLEPIDKMEEILSIKLPSGRAIGKNKNSTMATRYLISRCYWARHCRSKWWVQINARLMGEYYGGNPSRWKVLRDTLINAGVVEMNLKKGEGPKPRKQSYKFRICPKWSECELKHVDEPNWPDHRFEDSGPKKKKTTDVKNVAKTSNSKQEKSKPPKKVIDGLTLNKPLALELAKMAGVARNWSPQVLQCKLEEVENFDATYRMTVTGRVITQANRLARPIREAILLYDTPTLEIDISNCHPLLLTTLIPRDSEEYFRYKMMAQSGKLYEKIGNEIFNEYSRKKIKKIFLLWVNKSSRKENSDIARLDAWMKENFTLVWEVVQKHPGGKSKDSLAHKLQRLEGDHLWRVLEAKGIPHVSVHDGARIRHTDHRAAENAIRESYASIGLVVSIGVVDLLSEIENVPGFYDLGLRQRKDDMVLIPS